MPVGVVGKEVGGWGGEYSEDKVMGLLTDFMSDEIILLFWFEIIPDNFWVVLS